MRNNERIRCLCRIMKLTAVIAEDEPLLRAQLRVRLGRVWPDLEIVAECGDGEAALEAIERLQPQVAFLDIRMPELTGVEVAQRVAAKPALRCHIVFVTAYDEYAIKAFEAGAADYLLKPYSEQRLAEMAQRLQERFAEAGSGKNLDGLMLELASLQESNRTLAEQVAEGVDASERLGRLRHFFSPAVAARLLSDRADEFLQPRRREIVVVFLDLRGYTAFTDAHDADTVIRVLSEFHEAMGELIMHYEGTLERFAGDGLMIFFNDPVEIPAPAHQALAMVMAMHQRFDVLKALWHDCGYRLDLGIGIAKGEATLGAIGFAGRRDYGAIGGVTNLAARLCGEAAGGQILLSSRVANEVATDIPVRDLGPRTLKGFRDVQAIFEVITAADQSRR